MEGHVHRANTNLKQVNKKAKAKHSSKRELKRNAKGKIAAKEGDSHTTPAQTMAANGKANRKNTATQQRKAHSKELLSMARMQSSRPRVVMLVELTPFSSAAQAKAMIEKAADLEKGSIAHGDTSGRPQTFWLRRQKHRMTLLTVERDLDRIIDAAKVADMVVYVCRAGDEYDAMSREMVGGIRAQGVPQILGVMQGMSEVPPKLVNDVRKRFKSLLEFELNHDIKVLTLDNDGDVDNFIRHVACSPVPEIRWRDAHPYMIADRFAFEPAPENPAVGTARLTGFLRGDVPLSANRLLHILNYGDFQIQRIEQEQDLCPANVRRSQNNGAQQGMGMGVDPTSNGSAVLDTRIEALADDLVTQNEPDFLNNEQTWPTEDELREAMQAQTIKKRKPKGMSDYQAAWLPSDDEVFDTSDEDSEDNNDNDDAGMSNIKGKGKEPAGSKSGKSGKGKEPADTTTRNREAMGYGDHGGSDDEDEDGWESMEDDEGDVDDEDEDANVGEGKGIVEFWDRRNKDQMRGTKKKGKSSHRRENGGDDEDDEQLDDEDDVAMDLDEIRRTREFEMSKRSKEDMDFPDEVDTPLDVPARQRFVKFRGLKSFRTSTWDPKESLPVDYARIFQYENAVQTSRSAKRPIGGAEPGQYVVVVMDNFPRDVALRLSGETLVVAAGLHQYENKMTLMSANLQRVPGYEEPVMSKEEMMLHVGWRKLLVRPIYSENGGNAQSKKKYLRFFQPGTFATASMYMPTTWGPCPTLMFKLMPGTRTGMELVASGSLTLPDPDRLVIKRVILTGYPYKIHQRTATIRFMFFNPEDIRWFKPVELWTKLGRIGSIKCPLGTHGMMKCAFNNPIQGNDTVCMSLYKRVFPKWNTVELLKR